MANFEGYLFKSGNDIFPHQYINYESYSTLPNSREEIKAYRDDNTRDLTRVTASGTKSSFSFKTRPNLHLDDIRAILEFFTRNESSALERKIELTYWNNESLEYKTSNFYRADITFEIKQITDNDIIYNEAEISLVEY